MNAQTFFQGISCCPGYIGYDRSLLSKKCVQKRRFPNVRLSQDNRADAFFHDPAVIGVFQELPDIFTALRKDREQSRTIAFHLYMLRIIQRRLNISNLGEQERTFFPDFFRNAALKLCHRAFQSKIVLRIDHIDHGLRLT